MYTTQAGIFALGTSSHAYLEFDLPDAKQRNGFAAALASIREPRTTTGGVNFVIGFRPELWSDVAPSVESLRRLRGPPQGAQGQSGSISSAAR